ncbi:biosynthetic peptidoglycan transglycosylase [Geomonas limicola]|uniref:biosynthetic peptidoglycan transglycosylase n=1 Tax=Geomonas limicola TaxID=2740186 RepID=UPI0016184F97|nr:biosynthetic peptidoglycan transglycosylase [Geomonas limicola]
MIDDDLDRGWRQHFPTYAFKERDVALEEYKTAAKSLESEERVFLNASNIAVIVAAGLGSLAVGSLDKLSSQFKSVIPSYVTMGVLLSFIMGLSVVSLLYFADRQRALVFAARKVIVLRRMMGLSYGTVQLILPNWRVEGADEPFAIKLFPGWFTYVTYPYYALAGISSAVIFFLLACLAPEITILKQFTMIPLWVLTLTTSILWAFLLAYTYRGALLDVHEHRMLLFTQNLAKLLRFRIVTNFEHVIYRATLARYEMNRLKIKTDNLKTFLILIEDRNFYKHSGVSMRALIRASLGLINIKRRSGGSTITQQLVRTLFIHDQSKLLRRKSIEILLAICFDKIFTKNEQIDLYLASVRFERGVYGVMEAMHFFWNHIVAKPSKAESFFLIERVSNINSKILVHKIVQTARYAKTLGMFTDADLDELLMLYRDATTSGKIKDLDGGMALLSNFFHH